MASSAGSTGGASSNQGHAPVVTDVTQIFDLLESNNPDIVQEVKELILENLNGSKYIASKVVWVLEVRKAKNRFSTHLPAFNFQLKRTGL